jgi:hypothetical protein
MLPCLEVEPSNNRKDDKHLGTYLSFFLVINLMIYFNFYKMKRKRFQVLRLKGKNY